jgi:(2R)-sulfolactate sulfo-lyase subunit alpha
MLHFLIHGVEDNVAVAVVEVNAGTRCECLNMESDKRLEIEAAMDIPLGHKIALADLAPGDTVIKYDHDIGRVVAPIKRGEHVHVHNLKTKRW